MNVAKISAGIVTASLLSLWMAGCSCHSCFTGHGSSDGKHKLDYGVEIAPGALPDPTGAHVRRFQATQRTNAVAIEYAIFLHEWENGGEKLGPYGEHHVQHIIRRLATVPYPVQVQPTHDAKINNLRRSVVVARLLEGGIHDAEARVMLRDPEAEGLFGDEAPKVYQKLLTGAPMNTGFGFGNVGSYLPGMVGGFGGGFGGFGGGFYGGGFGSGFYGGGY